MPGDPVKKQHRFTPIPATTLKSRVLGFLIATLVRLHSLTLRIRLENKEVLGAGRGPVIWAFWHNRMLVLPVVYRRYARDRPACVLTSPSGDGALLSAVMKRFGLESVRGSTNKRAAQSLVECRRRLLDGWDLAVTPDGPRGPACVVAPGVLQLARVTGCPVLPVRVEYSKMWRLKSWDRFRIPKPFSRVTVTLGSPLTFGEGPLDDQCRQLESALGGNLEP
jgi:lysophospholipid acyltransferase (LPLAT)-like uncharacterized protein